MNTPFIKNDLQSNLYGLRIILRERERKAGLGFFRKKLISSRTVEESGKNRKKWKKVEKTGRNGENLSF